MEFIKSSFHGGMNQLVDPTKLDPQHEQYLSINVRVRRNTMRAVYQPAEITGTLQNQPVQALYGIGQFLVAFVGGLAYYYDTASAIYSWTRISQFNMGSAAPKLWVEFVAAATLTWQRVAQPSGTQPNGAPALPTTLSIPGVTSPVAAVVMDGVNQPWLIAPNLSSRVTQNYNQWTPANPEYVPIAKMPLFGPDNVLYCVGKDAQGNFTRIFRSVTGQPLNFVIAVDINGNKIDPTEAGGGAAILATGPSFDPITTLKRVATLNSSFFVTSRKSAYAVTPNYTNLIYGEPQFSNQTLFDFGGLNNECTVDVLGDTAIVTEYGVTSFNSIQQYRFEGRNAPFSAKINNIIDGIAQPVGESTGPSTVAFDNYAGFALKTKYGVGILWYDMLTAQWVSLDLYEGVNQIVQFATTLSPGRRRLFFYTDDNKIYEAFATTTIAPATVYFAEMLSQPGTRYHKMSKVRATYGNFTAGGTVQLTVIGDRSVQAEIAQNYTPQVSLPQTTVNESIPFDLAASQSDTAVALFDSIQQSEYCRRIGILLQWNLDADLLEVSAETNEITQQRVAGTLQPVGDTTQHVIVFAGSADGTFSAAKAAQIRNFNPDLVVITGDTKDVAVPSFSNLLVMPGAVDLNGSPPFIFWNRWDEQRYFRWYSPWDTTQLKLVFFNTGFNSASTQTEPDLSSPIAASDVEMQWLQASPDDTDWTIICGYDSPVYPGSGTRQAPAAQLAAFDYPFADAWVAGSVKAYAQSVDGKGLPIFNNGSGEGAAEAPGNLTNTTRYLQTNGLLVCTIRPLSLTWSYYDLNNNLINEYIVRR